MDNKAWDEKKFKEGRKLTKVKKLYAQARARVLDLCAVEVFGLRKNIDRITDEVMENALKLQTILDLVEDTTNL